MGSVVDRFGKWRKVTDAVSVLASAILPVGQGGRVLNSRLDLGLILNSI